MPVTAHSPSRECIAIAKLIMEKSEELSSLFKSLKADHPDGMITKENVIAMLKLTIPEDKAEIIADLIFTAFDKDRDGTIDFHEFMMATNCSTTTMLEEKLHWVFQMYDKDGSNSIQLGEMVEIFSMIYLIEGIDENLAVERAEQVFHMLDEDNDGDVTEEEFVKGCMEDDDLVKELTGKSKEHEESNKGRCSLPRNSLSVERRSTTKRRYSNRF